MPQFRDLNEYENYVMIWLMMDRNAQEAPNKNASRARACSGGFTINRFLINNFREIITTQRNVHWRQIRDRLRDSETVHGVYQVMERAP
jgi:hypothetical protein